MVNLAMPTPPQEPLEPKKPVKASAWRQLLIYLFYILLIALTITGLWYAQTTGYIDLTGVGIY